MKIAARTVLAIFILFFISSCGGGSSSSDTTPTTSTFYKDADGDSYSDGTSEVAETASTGYYLAESLVATSGDCDDGDAAINPGVAEIWYDGTDQNCDGASDYDQDTDGDDSDAYAGTDCDDTDATINPAAEEIWYDGMDQNCDGASDYDQDGDGFDSDLYSGTDCDDLDAFTNPDEADICDTIDNNCDGLVDNDVDGDGWTACDGDCCESTLDCSDPALVNPGAMEFVGNGLDDDCDVATSDTVDPTSCSTSQDFYTTASEMAQALDLCEFTTASPPLLSDKKWGVISAEYRHADGTTPDAARLTEMENLQGAVLTDYGSNNLPRRGNTMAGISTGNMRDKNDPDFVGPQQGISFGAAGQPPAVYLTGNGGSLPAFQSCDGDTCPSGSGANDSINLRLTIRVPTNALSFSYNLKFFSSEYPEWTCSEYNDFYLALLTSGASGIPVDTNISFDVQGNPISVNNAFFESCTPSEDTDLWCYTCPSGTADLVGTGMDDGVGGGSNWLVTTAPVVPGETMVLELMVFDVSDYAWDTNVLLDNFQWSLSPSSVGTGREYD